MIQYLESRIEDNSLKDPDNSLKDPCSKKVDALNDQNLTSCRSPPADHYLLNSRFIFSEPSGMTSESNQIYLVTFMSLTVDTSFIFTKKLNVANVFLIS